MPCFIVPNASLMVEYPHKDHILPEDCLTPSGGEHIMKTLVLKPFESHKPSFKEPIV